MNQCVWSPGNMQPLHTFVACAVTAVIVGTWLSSPSRLQAKEGVANQQITTTGVRIVDPNGLQRGFIGVDEDGQPLLAFGRLDKTYALMATVREDETCVLHLYASTGRRIELEARTDGVAAVAIVDSNNAHRASMAIGDTNQPSILLLGRDRVPDCGFYRSADDEPIMFVGNEGDDSWTQLIQEKVGTLLRFYGPANKPVLWQGVYKGQPFLNGVRPELANPEQWERVVTQPPKGN